MNATIRPALLDDSATIATLIRELAVYERLEDQAKATADDLARHLFGDRPAAEVLIAEVDGTSGRIRPLSSRRSRPSEGSRGSTSKTSSSAPSSEAKGSARPCWRASRGSPSTEGAAGLNGRSSTGTRRRSNSTDPKAPSRWTSGPSSAWPTGRWMTWPG